MSVAAYGGNATVPRHRVSGVPAAANGLTGNKKEPQAWAWGS
jgi:hypothetical protein